jgi:multidrug efflux pump subunit AcrB
MADTCTAQRISQLKGVGVVSSSVANQNGSKGALDDPARAYTINTNDRIEDADEYENIIIAHRNRPPVRLRDVATPAASAANTKLGEWMNRTPALIINVSLPAKRTCHAASQSFGGSNADKRDCDLADNPA